MVHLSWILSQKIEDAIGKIKTCMEKKQLKMNDAKTEFIVLGTSNNLRKNTLHNIEIGKTKIYQVSKLKISWSTSWWTTKSQGPHSEKSKNSQLHSHAHL